MKIKLLKKFRKRFKVIRFSEKSYALLDHKTEQVIYNVSPGNPIKNLSTAISVGVSKLIDMGYHYQLIQTRRKRMYRSLLNRKA